MDKIKRIAWWLSIPPLVVAFWTFTATVVHFWDDLEYVLEVVTVEGVTQHQAMWMDYQERMETE